MASNVWGIISGSTWSFDSIFSLTELSWRDKYIFDGFYFRFSFPTHENNENKNQRIFSTFTVYQLGFSVYLQDNQTAKMTIPKQFYLSPDSYISIETNSQNKVMWNWAVFFCMKSFQSGQKRSDTTILIPIFVSNDISSRAVSLPSWSQ